MKTVKRGDDVKRVSDTEVAAMVKRDWEYCSKKTPEGAKRTG